MKGVLTLIGLIISISSSAQALKDFVYVDKTYNNDSYIDLVASYTYSMNNKAKRAEAHKLNGFTAKVGMRWVDFDLGERKAYYQHKLFFDLVLILNNHINGKKDALNRKEGSGITTGIIGWYSLGWNVLDQERLSLAVGFNLNDYFLTNSFRFDYPKDDLTAIEPQGYWFTSGPTVFCDYSLGKNFLLHCQASYSMGYWRAVSLSYGDTQVDDSYPKPHLASFNLELQSKWALFLGMDYTKLINRGDNPVATQRLDLLLGFKLPL